MHVYVCNKLFMMEFNIPGIFYFLVGILDKIYFLPSKFVWDLLTLNLTTCTYLKIVFEELNLAVAHQYSLIEQSTIISDCSIREY